MINPIAIKLGAFQIHWYGIIIACAVLIAIILSIREGKRHNLKADFFYDYLTFAIPISLLFARSYYVLFQWKYYRNHPLEIYRIWDGGIAIYGALIGALIVLIIFCKKHGISIWLFLDVISPSVILAQGIGRWGNFINQEAHGKATSKIFLEKLHLPNFVIEQMKINGTYYQPTFLYESVWDVLGFVLLVFLRRFRLFKGGEIFLVYLVWYSFGRFFIEQLRTDSLLLGNLRVSQWLSTIIFIVSIGILIYRRYYNPLNPFYLDLMQIRLNAKK